MTRSFRFHSPKPKKARPEARLQKAVVQHLRLTGTPGVLFFSIPNEGKRTPASCADLKLMGMLPGVSDLLILVPGAPPLFLEIKAHGGKQSPEQLQFENRAVLAGCQYWVAYNIDTALYILRKWNAIRPDARRAA